MNVSKRRFVGLWLSPALLLPGLVHNTLSFNRTRIVQSAHMHRIRVVHESLDSRPILGNGNRLAVPANAVLALSVRLLSLRNDAALVEVPNNDSCRLLAVLPGKMVFLPSNIVEVVDTHLFSLSISQTTSVSFLTKRDLGMALARLRARLVEPNLARFRLRIEALACRALTHPAPTWGLGLGASDALADLHFAGDLGSGPHGSGAVIVLDDRTGSTPRVSRRMLTTHQSHTKRQRQQNHNQSFHLFLLICPTWALVPRYKLFVT